MLPTVVQDSVTDAATRLGLRFIESLFYYAALESGYIQTADEKAKELTRIWLRQGEDRLPEFAREFVLRVCNGEFINRRQHDARKESVCPDARVST